ncbi:hypothetical protein TELCIR_05386 [Teladorsagia circumcincta]|uniref:Uncharacterized protein n=1 Tax=Teladorsagia circumcincta TaxID=45464 RepID=A0A2G9UQZ0_TELCI|nr:hypothetical protein TELCIR_05386 [Teladorsagia circumcincta]
MVTSSMMDQMAQVEVLNEELEKLTMEADRLLGEVVRCRASYPGVIATLKTEECRDKFIRLLEAPLKTSRPLGIDKEKIKNDITRRVEESQDLSEMRKTLEEKAQQLKAEYASYEERYRKLLDLATNNRYAPIDALPDDFTIQLTHHYS